MPLDIVFPQNNEQKFIDIASKLGYTDLVFVYPFQKNIEKLKEQLNNFKDKKINLHLGILSEPKNIQHTKKTTKYVFFKPQFNNQPIIENNKNIIAFSFEKIFKKDSLHFRGSGLNQVLCKLMHKNNIIFGFSLNELLKTTYKKLIFGRISQNIRLCRKYKVKTLIASFATTPYGMRSPYDLSSLFISLGMTNSEARLAINRNL